MLVALIGINISANAQKRFVENNNLLASVESTSSTTFDILVSANQAVDDLCNYFNGSWVNTGLTLYCTFGGDVVTCTAYKIVQATCTINGAVRLYIEGNAEAALKKLLIGSAKVYTVSKVGGKFYIK